MVVLLFFKFKTQVHVDAGPDAMPDAPAGLGIGKCKQRASCHERPNTTGRGAF
jgi:hypothetical protein